jgi:hypothetical protein
MKKLIIVYCLLTICSAQAANEINAFAPGVSTAYSVIREVDGDVWYVSGQVFEAWGTGGRTAADYDISLTDKSGDMFVGDFDSNVSAGYYHIATHYQTGGSPADADPMVWQEYGYWDASSWTSGPDALDIDAITDKLPTNYIMGSSTQNDQDTIILSGQVPDNTSTADSIKLAADASGSNDIYNENLVVLVGGTGAGQARLIADYIGATETAIVRNAWLITPDNTTLYRIYPFSGILLSNTGLVVAATSSTITLNTSAQAVADVYVGHTIFISGGTGLGQARLITAYTAGRVATISPDWDVTPGAAASVYLILPVGRTFVDELSQDVLDDMADSVWDEAVADHTTETSFGGELGTLDPNITLIKYKTDLITILDTSVKDANDANNFTIDAGIDVNDALRYQIIMVEDADDSHYEVRYIDNYDENSTDPNIWVDDPFSFTPATGDIVHVMGTGYGGYLWNIWYRLQTSQAPTHIIDTTGRVSPGGGGVTRYDAGGDDP